MANNKDDKQIVIRRIKKVSGGGHHGGAWKIAYADFVTAMMAFFLLMWLLGSTTKGELNGIADYFNSPLKVAMEGGSGAGDSSSLIKGGGTDLSRTAGQTIKGTPVKKHKAISLQAARAEIEKQEKQEKKKLNELKAKIEAIFSGNEALSQFKNQVKLDVTPEGLRIQIVDEKNRPMFDSGRAALKDYTKDILREIAIALNEVDNRISLSGHTDAQAFASGDKGYSNWELSSDRANAARREMVLAGMEDKKVLRVLGLSSAVPFDKKDVYAPANRRITITVLNKKMEEAIETDGLSLMEEGGSQ